MKIWNDEEVKDLFDAVELCKNDKKPLKFAFECHAEKYNKKANSVRNYYYKEVDNLGKDDERLNRLGIKLETHKKYHFITFEKQEEENMLNRISDMVSKGESVRSACFKISNGDLVQMTRLQNKYQNIRKKESNIIQFRKKSKPLSENEINSLFLGLVKLIKKTTLEEFVEKANKEKEASDFLLKQAFADINKKDEQIKTLQLQFESLKRENQGLISQIKVNSKNLALKEHLCKRNQIKIEQN